MNTASFHIEESDFGEVHQIRLQGDLDLAVASRVEDAISDALDTNRSVELDLRELAFIDSTGVHAVVAMCERSRTMGKLFSIVPGPPGVQRVFEILELADVLPFARGLDEEIAG